jgi:superfamily II DNA or RNA helicase
LVYLFKAIEHRKIESVGYYIGGMKKKDLKISETKKIIVATYSMAAEALDIKTLTTLVMASPKTDIEQAVGRILRVKDNNALVIDIIDSHDIFKKQWQTRKQFYFKNNYKIIHTDNYSANIWNDIEKKERRGKKGNIIKLCNDIDENLVGKCMISL